MDILIRVPELTFGTKASGEDFLKRMRAAAYKWDVIPVNDILKDRNLPVIKEGFQYGYDRKTIKKIKVEKKDGLWTVIFPAPGKMVRDQHGYWTTENPKASGQEQLCLFEDNSMKVKEEYLK